MSSAFNSIFSSSSKSMSAMPAPSKLQGHVRVGKVALLFGVVIACFACVPQCEAEYFSSVDSLQKLGHIELGLLKMFREFLETQQQEFASYRKFIEHVKAEHSLALNDLEGYLGNPINAFTLIKRLVNDWNQLTEYVKQSAARQVLEQTLSEYSTNTQFPDDAELGGAIRGLARLQNTYNLKAEDLAKGDINGVNYGSELSWHDCFEIATYLFDSKQLSLSIEWFHITLDKLEDEDNEPVRQKFEMDTLEYLALASHELGFIEEALEYIDDILDELPDHSAKDTRVYIQHSASKKIQGTDVRTNFPWYRNYTRLCQGQQVPEEAPQQLECRLETRNNPIFILAPLQVEEISLDPEITLCHGLLNDNQIQSIVKEAESNMQRSGVVNGTGTVIIEGRVSQQSWLQFESPLMKSVYQLMSAVTGLDMVNAEQMQMANYGIGGLYEPHHDFFGDANGAPGWTGDRIMTNMFYLSDVEQGGYTVFPLLNVYLPPVKGALVSWYNLHRSLDPDHRTLHAGCPVVKGSKRIGNIWIHAGHQEFRRLCELTYDTSSSDMNNY